ncbi:cancer/testis antigen 55-like [Apodemus sylvaticus]|uniref:cancer/testis antigen 55-like n=1 Tax=Apodemus sylvaticus TaxID=10129 RepID=UPI002244195E|nr:cancer/testis antigen 55-like [Apodemus sylvaticus]
MLKLLRWASAFFLRRNMSEETSQEQPLDNSKFKSVQGVVTSLCMDYGWINESIFFKTEAITDDGPLDIGSNVLAFVEKDELTHILKAITVKPINDLSDKSDPSNFGKRLCIKCVSFITEDDVYINNDTCFPLYMFSGAFKPFKGDLLLIEYSTNPGTSKINIHSVSPLNSQYMDEVCVTSIDGRNGVVEANIFFTLDSLHTLPGYTPRLYDIVNATVIDSIQSHYSRRVVSMTPVDMLY